MTPDPTPRLDVTEPTESGPHWIQFSENRTGHPVEPILVYARDPGASCDYLMWRECNVTISLERRWGEFSADVVSCVPATPPTMWSEYVSSPHWRAMDLLRRWATWWDGPGREHYSHFVVPPLTDTRALIRCGVCQGITDVGGGRCAACGREVS